VMAPPIIPPTQKMATATDQMMVTFDWSTTWPVLLYSVSVIHSSISWNREEAQLQFPWGYTTQHSYTLICHWIKKIKNFWYKKTRLDWTLERIWRLEEKRENKDVIYFRITSTTHLHPVELHFATPFSWCGMYIWGHHKLEVKTDHTGEHRMEETKESPHMYMAAHSLVTR
jgi:hypothetical protein